LRWDCTILAGLAAACAGPSMTVTATPAEARVYVDGRHTGAGEVTLPNAYYGVHAVYAAPPLLAGDLEPPKWQARRQTVALAEPATPWIFPLDFVVELATSPWRQAEAMVDLRLPPYTAEAEPTNVELLSERAAAARIGR
jgi:hypothetical protein